MGNEASTGLQTDDSDDDVRAKSMENTSPRPVVEFFSSAGKTIGQASGIVCGKLDDTFEDPDDVYNPKSFRGFSKKNMNSPFADPEDDASLQSNPMSHLFARALLNEVTDNPSTMTPAKMAEREKKLLKAQKRAFTSVKEGTKVIGGQGTVRTQIERAGSRIIPPNLLSEQKAQLTGAKNKSSSGSGKYSLTIGLMMSMKDPSGNPNTVTRQRAFDFNMLQDREQRFVSSTDDHGWRAGGGEKGGMQSSSIPNRSNSNSDDHESDSRGNPRPKIPTPDTVHIPIINIDCQSEATVNSVIASLARGEIFIPYMTVMPESLGVNGVSPPDLVVRFGCERDEELSPEDWPNWCLEFMHNQLYEYFEDVGACWMRRPFQLTLAKKVRWKTVKHMNQYFAKAETVINSWRERGPQLLQPELSHIDGGATPEEVARPYGIYLLRNGKPTNYFAPNFEPPYTTKMTRSLLTNVLSKSWDKRRRDWSNEPIPSVTPSLLLTSMCGCADPGAGGFVAREATNHFSPIGGGTKFFDDKTVRGTILFEGMKISREDSGITRSQLGNVHSPNRISAVSTRQNKSTNNEKLSSEMSKRHNYSERTRHTQSDSEASNSRSDKPSSITTSDVQSLNKEAQYLSKSDELETFSSDVFELNIRDSDENADENEDHDEFISPQHASFNPEFKTPVITNNREQSNFNKSTKNEVYHSTGMSVAESQTTVPIMNKSTSNKLIEQQRERRKEREIEREMERRKIDQLEMAIQEKLKLHEEKKNREQVISLKNLNISSDPSLLHDSITETESPLDSDDDSSRKKSSKKDKKSKKERKKREKKERKEKERSQSVNRNRERHHADTNWEVNPTMNNNISANKNGTSDKKMKSSSDGDGDPNNIKSRIESITLQQKESIIQKNSRQPSSYLPINLNGRVVNDQEVQSQASMDYSMDTASIMDGSLIGAQFAGDSSVFTMGTSASDGKSLLSYVTRSTVHDLNAEQSNQARSKQSPAVMPSQQEEDDSILDSEEEEEIPSDEALFAIGWAKALDPNSGCYYYFTLDRTETVWENPLLQTEF